MAVQFNIDSRFNEDARYKKVLFGYDGQLLEVELNEMQDILNARLAEVVDNVFGSRPLYAGTYSVTGGVLTIANEVVVANRELILLNSTSIPVANGDTIYLNVQTATKAYTDSIKKYGDQNSNTTVTNSIEDSRVGAETTRRVQVTYMLTKTNTNPGTNIQLCTINSSGAVVKGNPDSFTDSTLYAEIRRLANEQQTANNLQPLKNVYGTVVAGGTSVPATTTADTLTFAAGTAVSISGTASSKTVTISVPNATTAADGSMTAGDKTKLNGIATGAQVNQNAFSNAIVGASTLAATTTTDSLTFAASGAVTVSGSGKTVTIGMPNATTAADGSMASGDKTKLNGIATGAEVNQNAWSVVTAGGVTVSSSAKTDTLAFATSGAITLTGDATNKKVTIGLPNATESADGGMSAADKQKLDGMAAGATVNQDAFSTIVAGGTTMAATTTTDTFTFAASGAITITGANKTATIGIPAASSTTAGSMSSTDKAKLDAINQALSTSDSPSFPKVTLSVATGTAPLVVTSTTKVANLNVDQVDGYDFDQDVRTTASPSFSKVTSTVATGTAPFTVASTTTVSNLSADMVDGYHLDQDVRTTASPTHVKLTLSQAAGTAPMTVTSTTVVPNLNVDMVDGYHMNQDVRSTASPSFAGLSFTAAQGTAPFTVTSTTKVANLNADMVDGYSFNQGVQTTDSPTFAGVTASGAIYVQGQSAFYNNTNLMPKGTATSSTSYSSNVLAFGSSTWSGSAAVSNWRTILVDSGNVMRFTDTSANNVAYIDNSGVIGGSVLASTVATGTAPLSVSSTTKVTNLNADMVDGYHMNQGVQTTDSPTFAKVTAPTFASTVATGTAPLTVASTTAVTNLNADMVDGYHMNQNVQTTSSPTFAGMSVNGQIATSSSSNTPAILLSGASAGWASGLQLNNTTASTGRKYGIYSGSDGTFHITDETAATTRMYIDNNGNTTFNAGSLTAPSFVSNVATGTAPLSVTSTTAVTNLNADMVDGYHMNQDVRSTASPTFAGVSASTFTSTVASGTAPFTVSSTTKVTNLNADMVDGYSMNQDVTTAGSPSFSKMTSTVATGTAPLTVTSTTTVTNLSADMVDGYHLDQDVRSTASPTHPKITLNVATGTAPLVVTSTTNVANLSADMVDGYHMNQDVTTSGSPSFSRMTSTVATGTAPFTVASTTAVTNLNADMVDGIHGSSLVQTSRNVSTGSGLSGGGALSADLTLSVSFGGSGSATTVARSDHNHTGTYVRVGGGDNITAMVSFANNVPLDFLDTSGNATTGMYMDTGNNLHVGNTSVPLQLVSSGGTVKLIGAGATGAANVSWLGFYEADGSTRRGWVGDGGTNSTDITLASDSGNVGLSSATQNVTLSTSYGTVLTANTSGAVSVAGDLTAYGKHVAVSNETRLKVERWKNGTTYTLSPNTYSSAIAVTWSEAFSDTPIAATGSFGGSNNEYGVTMAFSAISSTGATLYYYVTTGGSPTTATTTYAMPYIIAVGAA